MRGVVVTVLVTGGVGMSRGRWLTDCWLSGKVRVASRRPEEVAMRGPRTLGQGPVGRASA
jgi:hypothetical protein